MIPDDNIEQSKIAAKRARTETRLAQKKKKLGIGKFINYWQILDLMLISIKRTWKIFISTRKTAKN